MQNSMYQYVKNMLYRRIGNNVKIGAGCIVVTDIPDDAVVVMNKPRIIIKQD